MKYTQKELEIMSDRDIDRICAVCHGYGYDYIERNPDNAPNYCGKWGDCGELIDEIGICIFSNEESDIETGTSRLTGEWTVSAIDYGDDNEASLISDLVSCRSDNQKRAVAIVYILIKQSNE